MRSDLDDLVVNQEAAAGAAFALPATQSECARTDEADVRTIDRAAHAALAVATSGLSPASLCLAWFDWVLHLAVAPGKWIELAQCATQATPKGHASSAEDPRFTSSGWDRWPFSMYRDAFLHIQSWAQRATTGVLGVDKHHGQLVSFVARQMIDAMSPSNFALTNPTVLEKASRPAAPVSWRARDTGSKISKTCRRACVASM
jgi:polyhydroxyalkanoate synthase